MKHLHGWHTLTGILILLFFFLKAGSQYILEKRQGRTDLLLFLLTQSRYLVLPVSGPVPREDQLLRNCCNLFYYLALLALITNIILGFLI